MNIKTGISLITGVPGSGKSFLCVEKMLDTVRNSRRPIYTNLPLRWRVLKLWLKQKEGDDIAGLVRPITESTFNRFITRFRDRQRYLDERRHLGRRSALNSWYEMAGPDVIDGLELNWIPAGSVIMIDEAHHWYPNPALSNVRKKEPEELMSYLTMHRHLMHRIYFVTQADRQVSSTVKSLLNDQIQVTRIDADIPLLGIEFSRFGFVAFSIKEWDGVADPDNEPPLRTSTIFPSIPCNNYVFRLYSSFTHMGSLRDLKRELANVQDCSINLLEIKDEEPETMSFKKRMFIFFSILFFGCFSGMILDSCSLDEKTNPEKIIQAYVPNPINLIGFTEDTFLHSKENGDVVPYMIGSIFDQLTIRYIDKTTKTIAGSHSDGTIYLFQQGSWNDLGRTYDIVDSLQQQISDSRKRLEEGFGTDDQDSTDIERPRDDS